MDIVFLVIFIAMIIFVANAVKIVPQSERWVITRLGAYSETLSAGVGFIIPIIEKVHRKVSIADQVINDKEVSLDVVSKDNVVFGIQLLVVYRIDNPEKAVFRVDSVKSLVIGLVQSLVRSEIGRYELDAIQQDRESMNAAIQVALEAASKDYGITVSRSEITDVKLGQSTQKAMSEVLEAERQRRAAITRAEGQKRAIELNADAELYEKRQQAEAMLVTARATAEANDVIGQAIKRNGNEAAKFQIAQMQVDGLVKLSTSSNSKLIMIPGDASDGFTRAASILSESKP